jgi:hypothetical protein
MRKAMKTLTFEIEVDDETADRIRQSNEERLRVELLLKSLLQTGSRVEAQDRILKSMDRLSEEAKESGLTEEKLTEILAEIDKSRD